MVSPEFAANEKLDNSHNSIDTTIVIFAFIRLFLSPFC